jgi:hypothetical protein
MPTFNINALLSAVFTQFITIAKTDFGTKVLPLIATFISDVQAAGTDPLALQLAWGKLQAAFLAQLPSMEHDELTGLLTTIQAQLIALVTPAPAVVAPVAATAAPVVAAVAAKAA